MKLVKIEHYRCSELDKDVYYIAPEGMSDDGIEEAVVQAQKAYLRSLEVLAKINPPPKAPETDVRHIMPDSQLSVTEALEAYRKYELDLKAYNLKIGLNTESFEKALKALGFSTLWEYDGSDMVICTAVWGHRHGQKLDY